MPTLQVTNLFKISNNLSISLFFLLLPSCLLSTNFEISMETTLAILIENFKTPRLQFLFLFFQFCDVAQVVVIQKYI